MICLSGENIEIGHDLAVTIGKFDGLHRGHMSLIHKLIEIADSQGLAAAMLTFSPHPAAVLHGSSPSLILSKHEKISILSQMGLDYYIEYPFTQQFAGLSAMDFIKDIAIKQLRVKAMVVGENFRYGAGGLGNADLAKSLGLQVYTMPLITDSNVQVSANSADQVSANALRQMIIARDFDSVIRASERPYFIMGKVVHGKKKGREMGFPTANILVPQGKLLPPIGVYITTTDVSGTIFASITNIATDFIETHILDYAADLYDKTIRINFHQWMRNMRPFASYDELSVQLANDVADAKKYFGPPS